MGKLLTIARRINKRTAAAVAVIAAAIIVPGALFAWGPDRPLYTIEHPADHVTFNSITNNPNIGDERNFVGIREAGSNTLWKDTMNVERGKEYTVRMYVHNNAADHLNLVAENVTARFTLPTTTGKSVQVDGSITASNATPNMVYDHATFTGNENFNVAYVPGTLKFENNAFGAAGTALPESIFDQRGALLGYNKLDGKIPGCFQFAGYVTFKVKPQFAPKNEFDMTKQVRKAGETAWQKSVATKPGDTVEYQLSYKNTGEARQNNVVIKDMLPAGLTYVDGSTYLKNGTNPNAIKVSDNLTKSTGINVGDYNPAAAAYVKFSAKVNANDALPTCGPNKLTNKAQVIVDGGYKEDTADVTVPKECQPEVKYTCENLAVEKIERTKFKFTTTTSEQNATFKKVVYVIRNEQGTEVDRKESTAKTLDYTREIAGKYTVEALTTFTVNGADKTVTSASCKKPFEVTELPPSPKYTCDSLTVTKIERTKFKFETKYTAENATLKSIEYVIRDEAGNETRQTNSEYNQTKPGKYSVEAIVTVTVDGQDKRAPGDCKKQFEVVKENTPAVAIEKKVDGVEHKAVGVNQEFTYQVTVTNTGEVDLTNAEVTDNAPNGVTFQKASVGTITNNTWNYTIPSLKVGESKDFTITAKVPAYLAGKIVNTVCVNAPQVPGNPDDCDDASIEVPKTPETPVTPPATPVVPAELPKTGASDGIVALLGAGSLIAAVGYYIASRRALGA